MSQYEVLHGEAGKILRIVRPPFLLYAESLKSLYEPFNSREEWELAVWMHESGLSRSKMDAYFKLPHVHLDYFILSVANVP